MEPRHRALPSARRVCHVVVDTGLLRSEGRPAGIQGPALSAAVDGFDFKTTYHKNPQLTTTYRPKAPTAQYVHRIDAQIAVRFCAIRSI